MDLFERKLLSTLVGNYHLFVGAPRAKTVFQLEFENFVKFCLWIFRESFLKVSGE